MSAFARNKHLKFGNPKVDINSEEFDRIRTAFKNEEFRKLFFDYAEEIQDPENRKIYEEQIAQLEKERGVDITFIHPKPGFVVKTAIDGEIKCFINIASSPVVERPKNEICLNQETGERGLTWYIPMAQAPSQDDLDAKQKLCKVYDAVFHPDALHLAKKNAQFRQCLLDTALDGVEREFNVKLDRTNLKFPKIDYKGLPRATVIRKLDKNVTDENREPHPLEHMYPKKPDENAHKPKVLPMKKRPAAPPKFTEPKYSIKYSHGVDMSQMTDELDAKLQVTVPNEIVVEIELPLLRSTAECQLDVTEKSLYLLSERNGAKYRLKLDLPYVVNDKAGNARFDVDDRRLSITLPVVRATAKKQREMHDTVRLLSREDSGVELHSNSESPEEDEADEEEESEELEEAEIIEAIGDSPETKTDIIAFPPVSKHDSPRSFLSSQLHYQLPGNFTCNLLGNVMAFVLHVPNVQPDSIRTLQQPSSLHLQFASIGSGYFPTHYALLLQMPPAEVEPQPQLNIDHVETDASDQNVVLRLYMSDNCESLRCYLAGTNPNDLKLHHLSLYGNQSDDSDIEEEQEEAGKKSLDVSVEHDEQEKCVQIKIVPQNGPTQVEHVADDEPEQLEKPPRQQPQKKLNKKQRRRIKQRSLSESACEDIKAEEQQQQQLEQTDQSLSPPAMDTLKLPQRKQRSYSECHSDDSSMQHRGILKRFSRYGPRPSISDSSSSIDEYSSYSCSMDASSGVGFSQSFGGIPEERGSEAGLSESCKKTVRFNDHIMKQVFRHDSSILGQRKKNQKRRDRKLRAQQRRLSEGDSVDYEESDTTTNTVQKTVDKAQYLKQQNNTSSTSSSEGGRNITAKNKKGNKGKKQTNKDNEDNANQALMFEMDDVDE